MLYCSHTLFSEMFVSHVTVILYDQLNIVASLQQAEPVFSKNVTFSKIILLLDFMGSINRDHYSYDTE